MRRNFITVYFVALVSVPLISSCSKDEFEVGELNPACIS